MMLNCSCGEHKIICGTRYDSGVCPTCLYIAQREISIGAEGMILKG